MPTKRAQKRNRTRNNRKSRRGSGLIFGEKTQDENASNCENYWHPNNPNDCYNVIKGVITKCLAESVILN